MSGAPEGDLTTTPFGTTVRLGTRAVVYGGPDLQELRDCNHLLGDADALRAELAAKGFLFIRGLHDRGEVLAARQQVLEHLDRIGGVLDPTHAVDAGVLLARCGLGCVPFMEGRTPLTHSGAVAAVLGGPRPHKLFKTLFGEDALTFDYKWLRAMYTTGFTGAHVDNVYMSRGTDQLHTLWTPMGDIGVRMGTLCMLEGSNQLPGFARLQATYANMDAEAEGLQGTGWFTEDPQEMSQFGPGAVWKTADFKAGDALIFGMRTVHMSTANETSLARISCDTRWQPQSHPADPRYVGASVGHAEATFGLAAKADSTLASAPTSVPRVTIEQKKIEWGF